MQPSLGIRDYLCGQAEGCVIIGQSSLIVFAVLSFVADVDWYCVTYSLRRSMHGLGSDHTEDCIVSNGGMRGFVWAPRPISAPLFTGESLNLWHIVHLPEYHMGSSIC